MQPERQTSTKKAKIAAVALATVLVLLLALVVGYRALKQTVEHEEEPAAVTLPSTTLSPAETAPKAHQGFIFGRVTTDDGAIHEGRLRFGGDEEAFWGDYFNGTKAENPWVAQAPPEQLRERRPLEIFGVELLNWESQVNLARPFMARFGDIARIDANGRDLRVTVKSGTTFHLDRYAADDFADGVRVWDRTGGVADFDEAQIRSIDFLATGRLDTAPDRLHGTVRTRAGGFTGFIQWNLEMGIGSDELHGNSADSEISVRFDTVRSIARKSPNSSLVTLLDGKEIVLFDTGEGNSKRGMYVDDRRYGRVLISWDAFERVDFSPGESGPAYGDFPKGLPLTGNVITHDGRRIAGRLVYDMDESETIETLDAPSQGVDYTLLFGFIASVVVPSPEEHRAERAKVTLHSGEVLELQLAGDLGEGNTGLMIFVEGRKQPEFVRWSDIKQIHFNRPSAMYPPLESR